MNLGIGHAYGRHIGFEDIYSEWNPELEFVHSWIVVADAAESKRLSELRQKRRASRK
jgi:hypothetical protein